MRLLLLRGAAAAGAATLAKISAAGSAEVTNPAAGVVTLGKIVAAGSAAVAAPGSVVTLARISAAGSADVANRAVGAVTLRRISVAGSQGITLYKPPSPTGWKSTASRTGPASAFALGTRVAGEG
jgi:hypothetical protein